MSLLRRRGLPDAVRVGLLMAFAAALMAWKVGRTEIVFADGLRYIAQARKVDRGEGPSAVKAAVDHPLYPLAIVGAHRTMGMADDADGWQSAAQWSAVLAGVVLVLPLYGVARELFGRSSAWLGTLLVYVAPVPLNVLADALSEGTFLLFWTAGVWAALRFLKRGALGWLAAATALGALAYLVRPEGLLMPLALAGTLVLSPLWRASRLPVRRWGLAVATIGIGGLILVGPFVAFKGGLGTKPAVARLLGLAPPSPADAVERERPLDANQSVAQTAGLAARAVLQSVRDATTLPLLPFALLGLAVTARRRWEGDARAWLFLAVAFVGSILALLRLHATGGYCTPRHALLVALPMIAASATGLRALASGLTVSLRLRPGPRRIARRAPLTAISVAVALLTTWNAGAIVSPLNAGRGAYRDAGRWLADHAGPTDRVADVTGWSLFYGGTTGYTFADLHAAPGDPNLRWVVVRDAHLRGPWGYCERLRGLVRGSTLVARFPTDRRKGVSRVSVYERPAPPTTATSTGRQHW